MKSKKWMAMIVAVVLGLTGLMGCSSQSPAEKTDEGTQAEGDKVSDGVKIGVLIVTSASQWCNDIVDSVSGAVEKEGYEVLVSDSQQSVDNELSGMENLINSGCQAIVVNAMNPAGLADICKQAQDKGIYIIGWSDLLVNYDSLVLENEPKKAEMISEAIADFVDEDGAEENEMAVIWLADAANPDTSAGIVKEALEDEFNKSLVNEKGMKIVNSQYTADSNKAMDTAEAIIAANPEVKVIFCQSDEMGVAVAQTLGAKGIKKDQVMVCGLDGSDEALNAIAGETSCLSDVIYTNTRLIGEKIGESICSYLSDGTKVDVEAEYVLVNSENVTEYVPK